MVAQAVVFALLAVYDLPGAILYRIGEDDLLAVLDTAVFQKVKRTLLAACRNAFAQGEALKPDVRLGIRFLHLATFSFLHTIIAPQALQVKESLKKSNTYLKKM